jgi:hypothetical protein
MVTPAEGASTWLPSARTGLRATQSQAVSAATIATTVSARITGTAR